MPDAIKTDQILDCKGLLCPLPIIRTKQAIDKMEPGQTLEMISTDPGSVPDMQAWSRRTGHELLDTKKDNGLFVFYIRKTE